MIIFFLIIFRMKQIYFMKKIAFEINIQLKLGFDILSISKKHLTKKSILSTNEHCVNYLEGIFIFNYPSSFWHFYYFSYKLWHNYLKLRRKQIRSKCIIDPIYEEVNNTFERSLVSMHKVFYHNSFVFIISI